MVIIFAALVGFWLGAAIAFRLNRRMDKINDDLIESQRSYIDILRDKMGLVPMSVALAIEARQGQDAKRLDPKDESAGRKATPGNSHA